VLRHGGDSAIQAVNSHLCADVTLRGEVIALQAQGFHHALGYWVVLICMGFWRVH